jgi:hypothetical protein
VIEGDLSRDWARNLSCGWKIRVWSCEEDNNDVDGSLEGGTAIQAEVA